jgi:hypothetical protein
MVISAPAGAAAGRFPAATARVTMRMAGTIENSPTWKEGGQRAVVQVIERVQTHPGKPLEVFETRHEGER